MVLVIGFIKLGLEQNLGENDFLPIKLPWYVHPERDEAWRKRQDELLGDPRMAAQECDCDFSTSGDIVFYPEYIEYYEKTYIKDPWKEEVQIKIYGFGNHLIIQEIMLL